MKKLVFLSALLLTLISRTSPPKIPGISALPEGPLVAGCWLWAGRPASAVPDDMAPGAPVYVHQATLERPQYGHMIPTIRRQGMGPVNMGGRKIFVVYRLEQLPDPASIAELFSSDAGLWRLRGNEIAGLQIDFDSPTGRLSTYIKFLQELRRKICSGCALSVTGLADWASSAPHEELLELAGSTDEIVFQLYNGKSPIPSLRQYALQLSRFDRPFKIGVLPGQQGNLPIELLSSPQFRGAVIFLERS